MSLSLEEKENIERGNNFRTQFVKELDEIETSNKNYSPIASEVLRQPCLNAIKRSTESLETKEEKFKELRGDYYLLKKHLTEMDDESLETTLKHKELYNDYIHKSEKYLGISLEFLSGTLKIAFNKLSIQAPGSVAFVTISNDINSLYVLHECVPILDNMNLFIERLNKSKSLLDFVVVVRRAFKKKMSK